MSNEVCTRGLGVAGSKKSPHVAMTGGGESEAFLLPESRGAGGPDAPPSPGGKVRRSAHGDYVLHHDEQPAHPKSHPGAGRPVALVEVPYPAGDGARRRMDPRRP